MIALTYRKAIVIVALLATTAQAQWPWVFNRDTNIYAIGSSTTNGKPLSVKGVPGLAPNTNVEDIVSTGPLSYLRQNSLGTSLEWGPLPAGVTLPINNTDLANMGPRTVKANASAAVSTPTDFGPGAVGNRYLRSNGAGTLLEWGALPAYPAGDVPFAVNLNETVLTNLDPNGAPVNRYNAGFHIECLRIRSVFLGIGNSSAPAVIGNFGTAYTSVDSYFSVATVTATTRGTGFPGQTYVAHVNHTATTGISLFCTRQDTSLAVETVETDVFIIGY